MDRLFYFIFLSLFLTSCFPDSLTKWDEDDPVTNTTSQAGTTTSVPTSGTAPSRLSINQFILLQLSSTASFSNHDNISSSGGGVGIVVDVIDANYLLIKKQTGSFSASESVDYLSTFVTERATITTLDKVGIVLTLSSVGSFTAGESIAGSNGATGTVAYVDTGSSKVYIRVHSGPFVEATTVDDASSFSAAVATINGIYAQSIRATVLAGDASKFAAGHDVTSTVSSGHILRVDTTNTNDFYIELDNGSFSAGNTLVNSNPNNRTNFLDGVTAVSSAVIQQVASDQTLHIFRGDEAYYELTIDSGIAALYTISPSLPTGLSLDGDTGIISGTPTDVSELTTYTLTATNSSGSASLAFQLVVEDQIIIRNQTSNAVSYILHKAGQGNIRTNCRISQTQLDSSLTDSKDIVCYLEAGELDLYFSGLDFKIDAGEGMCEFVETAPYFFYNYRYEKTKYEIFEVYDPGQECGAFETIPGGALTTAPDTSTEVSQYLQDYSDFCASNYSSRDGPNCDDGFFEVEVTTYSDTDGNNRCELNSAQVSIEEISCGGSRSQCIQGPIKDVISDTSIDQGITKTLTTSDQGLQKDWTFKSPLEDLRATNKKLSNNISSNSCVATTDYEISVRNWEAYASSTTGGQYSDPFKGARPYYTVNCLDPAQDIQARIRLVVRDWDRDFRPANSIDLSGKTLSAKAHFDTSGTDTDARAPAASNFTTEGLLAGDKVIIDGEQLTTNVVGTTTFTATTPHSTGTLTEMYYEIADTVVATVGAGERLIAVNADVTTALALPDVTHIMLGNEVHKIQESFNPVFDGVTTTYFLLESHHLAGATAQPLYIKFPGKVSITPAASTVTTPTSYEFDDYFSDAEGLIFDFNRGSPELAINGGGVAAATITLAAPLADGSSRPVRIPPSLMDVGRSLDEFSNAYNNKSDWDDDGAQYEGCSVGTPTVVKEIPFPESSL